MSGACLRAISASKRFTSCLDSSVNSSLPLSKYRVKEIGRGGCAASALPKTSFTSLWLAVPRCTPPSDVVRAEAYAVFRTALPFGPWTMTVPTLPSLSGNSTTKSWLGVAQPPRASAVMSAASCRRIRSYGFSRRSERGTRSRAHQVSKKEFSLSLHRETASLFSPTPPTEFPYEERIRKYPRG